MGFYNVVAPCVVEGKHYVRAAVEEFDDAVAAKYVEAGSLTPYRPGAFVEKVEPDAFARALEHGAEPAEKFAAEVAGGAGPAAPVGEVEDFAYGSPAANPKPRSRSRRKSTKD